MKRILLSIVCALCALPPAQADVVVISPIEVRSDGVNLGTVADSIANHRELASDIQRALVAWATAKDAKTWELTTSFVNVRAAVSSGKITEVQAAIVEADKPVIDKELAEIDSRIAELQAKRAALAK